jgi:hypothetical protein
VVLEDLPHALRKAAKWNVLSRDKRTSIADVKLAVESSVLEW